MPAGKLGRSNAYGWTRPLSYRVSIRSLRGVTPNQKRPPTPLSSSEMRVQRRRLRFAFKRYLLDSSQYQMTATEARKELQTVVDAATAFARQLVSCRSGATLSTVGDLREHSQRFINAVDSVSAGTRSTLYVQLGLHNFDWNACLKMGHATISLFSVSKYEWETLSEPNCPSQAAIDRVEIFYRDTLPLIETIGAFDVGALIPASGRWRDPPLAALIAALEPIWHRVTNLTGARSSESESRFAAWLNSLLPYVGYSKPVPLGLVLDIIRSKKTGTITSIDKTG